MKKVLLIGLLCVPLAGCLPTGEPVPPNPKDEAVFMMYYAAMFNAAQTNWTMTIERRNP